MLKNINFSEKETDLNWLIQFKFDYDYNIDLSKLKENTLDNPNIISYYLLWRKRYNY